MSLNTATFTSASSDLANYTEVASGNLGRPGSEQVIRFFAQSADSSGSATLELALKNNTTGVAVARFTGTATITARRAAAAGDAGAYLCDVVWDESGSSKFDLMGAVPDTTWLLGLTAFTTADDLTVSWTTSQVI